MEEQQQYDLVCKPTLERIEGYCKKMFIILEGNGSDGLVTTVARHDERIQSIQSWVKWVIGFGTTILVAIIIYAFLTHNGEPNGNNNQRHDERPGAGRLVEERLSEKSQ